MCPYDDTITWIEIESQYYVLEYPYILWADYICLDRSSIMSPKPGEIALYWWKNNGLCFYFWVTITKRVHVVDL